MKRIIILSVATMLSLSLSAQKKEISAIFGYSTFNIPTGKPYVETYLTINSWSMNYEKVENNKFRTTAEISILIKKDDSVCINKKYNLSSPLMADTNLRFNLIDLQRFQLDNGLYDLELTIKDKNSLNPINIVDEKLVVFYQDKMPALSSVQLMNNVKKSSSENVFSRNGYYMEPYVDDYVPESISHLNFYYEIYNLDNELVEGTFQTYAYVENYETGYRMNSAQQQYKKHKVANVVPIYTSLDIQQLPSGKYNLVVEVHNKNKEKLLYKKVTFYRQNNAVSNEEIPNVLATFAGLITDEELMNSYLMALYPIASEREKETARSLAKSNGLLEKQNFFYEFWLARDKMNPEAEWKEYKERYDYVMANFSYPQTPGYNTDRGRVYLQYGAPDFVRDEKNFVATTRYLNSDGVGQIFYLPYQLWRYNYLPGDDPNRVFLFWDEMRSGFYKLLNSNAKGETRDPSWERRLSQQQLNEDLQGEVGKQFERGY